MVTMVHVPAVAVLPAIFLLLLLFPGGSDAWSGHSSPLNRPSSLSQYPQTALTALAAQRRGSDYDHHPTDGPLPSTRRSFLTRTASAVIAAVTAVCGIRPSLASPEKDDDLVDVYFGCGCFWHVHHEFVEAERRILGRSFEVVPARGVNAGGMVGGGGGRVCYHNAQNIADYGKLGHAEVVSIRIPTSKFEDFAVEYCKLFDKDGFRPDQFGDRGTEYRNLVGLPGGKSSPLAEQLVKASVATGDKLDFAVGKGDDKDLPKVSFIMDTAEFPFFVAEQYHQFHDGFKLDENYPNSYNSLANKFAQKGENFGTCPNGMIGIGIGGL